jgi:hypothetical protein
LRGQIENSEVAVRENFQFINYALSKKTALPIHSKRRKNSQKVVLSCIVFDPSSHQGDEFFPKTATIGIIKSQALVINNTSTNIRRGILETLSQSASTRSRDLLLGF